MTNVTVDVAQADLRGLIAQLKPSDQVLIVDNGQPIARLMRTSAPNWSCRAGSAKDKPIWVAPDFDAPLEDFREYME